MTSKVAIIGSRGIPPKYGGFETFVDEISKRLVAKGYYIYVSCEGGIKEKITTYNGVNLFYFPLKPFCRVIYETIYDCYSLIKSSIMCDYIYMLGYGAGFFFFIPKLFRKKLIVNVDGIEWRRDKYNNVEKLVLYLSEIFAVYYSDIIIADSFEIKKYIEAKHGKNAVFIPYGVEQPSKELLTPFKLKMIFDDSSFISLDKNSFFLVVARLEPENNIHIIIKGFLLSNTTKKLVIVGNFLSTKYELLINKIINDLNGQDRIIFTKGIYKKDLLNMMRQNCFVYIHGHSAGGTNPSLLEAMVMENIIIAHDNEFNSEVGDNTILYFKEPSDIKTSIENIENNFSTYSELKSKVHKRVLTFYSWDDVALKYSILLKNGTYVPDNITKNKENDSQNWKKKAQMFVLLDKISHYSLILKKEGKKIKKI